MHTASTHLCKWRAIQRVQHVTVHACRIPERRQNLAVSQDMSGSVLLGTPLWRGSAAAMAPSFAQVPQTPTEAAHIHCSHLHHCLFSSTLFDTLRVYNYDTLRKPFVLTRVMHDGASYSLRLVVYLLYFMRFCVEPSAGASRIPHVSFVKDDRTHSLMYAFVYVMHTLLLTSWVFLMPSVRVSAELSTIKRSSKLMSSDRAFNAKLHQVSQISLGADRVLRRRSAHEFCFGHPAEDKRPSASACAEAGTRSFEAAYRLRLR